VKYQLEATWTRECRAISSDYIPPDPGVEQQAAIDSAMSYLLANLSGQIRGIDPTTIRFTLKEIK